MNMMNGVTIRFSGRVKCSIIATSTPCATTVNLALVTLNFSGVSWRDRLWTGGLVVVIWWVIEWGRVSLWKDGLVIFAIFLECLQNVGFSAVLATEGDKRNPLRTEPDELTFVKGSVRKRLLISTRRPYLCKKSAPNVAFFTFAITKIWLKTRFKPKLSVKHFWPYVWMRDLLTAWRVNLWRPLFLSFFVAGIIDICAPLSTRKRMLVVWSSMNNRRLILLSPTHRVTSSCRLRPFLCFSLKETGLTIVMCLIPELLV